MSRGVDGDALVDRRSQPVEVDALVLERAEHDVEVVQRPELRIERPGEQRGELVVRHEASRDVLAVARCGRGERAHHRRQVVRPDGVEDLHAVLQGVLELRPDVGRGDPSSPGQERRGVPIEPKVDVLRAEKRLQVHEGLGRLGDLVLLGDLQRDRDVPVGEPLANFLHGREGTSPPPSGRAVWGEALRSACPRLGTRPATDA